MAGPDVFQLLNGTLPLVRPDGSVRGPSLVKLSMPLQNASGIVEIAPAVPGSQYGLTWLTMTAAAAVGVKVESFLAAYAAAILGAGASKLSYWRLGDAASPLADSGPNNLPLTVTGAPAYNVAGLLVGDPTNGALSAVGANTAARTVAGPANLAFTDEMTLIVWFKSNNAEGWLVGQGDNGLVDLSYFLQLVHAGPRYYPSAVVVQQDLSGPTAQVPGANLGDNVAHMAVVTFKRNDHLVLYIDGLPAASVVTTDSPLRASAQPFSVFASGDNLRFFRGICDEVSAMNVALTAAQVASFYALGSAVGPSQLSTVVPLTNVGPGPVTLYFLSPSLWQGLVGGNLRVNANAATPVSLSGEGLLMQNPMT